MTELMTDDIKSGSSTNVMNVSEVIMSDELKSDWAWRNLTAEAFAKWLATDKDWSHFITINYNIWRSSSGNVVYDNKSNTYTMGQSYRPYDKDRSRKMFQHIKDTDRVATGGNKEYWKDSGRTTWEAIRKMEHAKTMIRKWDTALHQQMFGKHFYDRNNLSQEKMLFILFPEHIHSNLHYHGFAKVINTTKFPCKIDDFAKLANDIWYKPPAPNYFVDDDGKKQKDVMKDYPKEQHQKQSVCPGGQVWLEEIKTDEDQIKLAEYSTKELKYYGNEEGLYITNDWRA